MDTINNKRPVYNGYEEYYMTGYEMQEYFKECVETYGRHHSKIYAHLIDFSMDKWEKIKLSESYRLFISKMFCTVFDVNTDEKLYFFGYIKFNYGDYVND